MISNVIAYINSGPTPQSQPTVSYGQSKFHLPMRDFEIFLKMNNDMDDEEVYKDFIRTLAVVHRGRTVDECTRKIYNYVFAKSLAMKINWLGTNGKCRLEEEARRKHEQERCIVNAWLRCCSVRILRTACWI
ncbi:hypothetical protein EG68_11815 [Paragonimus skrjabini miyazakii]|uniref:DUF4806 domain-containing protein n=1 Tax=Paragonimus skrjabini miyazakii TaxID=59628 RepID=A0A8S9YDW3_9TREM|nr:hypothetical protein EG68_11815 [Paragonimus skrjabini miyazakii]